MTDDVAEHMRGRGETSRLINRISPALVDDIPVCGIFTRSVLSLILENAERFGHPAPNLAPASNSSSVVCSYPLYAWHRKYGDGDDDTDDVTYKKIQEAIGQNPKLKLFAAAEAKELIPGLDAKGIGRLVGNREIDWLLMTSKDLIAFEAKAEEGQFQKKDGKHQLLLIALQVHVLAACLGDLRAHVVVAVPDKKTIDKLRNGGQLRVKENNPLFKLYELVVPKDRRPLAWEQERDEIVLRPGFVTFEQLDGAKKRAICAVASSGVSSGPSTAPL